jgi:hypothetical protein
LKNNLKISVDGIEYDLRLTDSLPDGHDVSIRHDLRTITACRLSSISDLEAALTTVRQCQMIQMRPTPFHPTTESTIQH